LQPEDTLDLERLDRPAQKIHQDLLHADREAALAALPAFAGCYTGELFADEPYEDWAAHARDKLRDSVCDLLSRSAALARASGDTDSARGWLRRLADLDPHNENRLLDLADCLLEARDNSAAAAALERVERVVDEQDLPLPGRYFDLHKRLTEGISGD